MVLAAGQGRRFGGDKLMASLGGRPLAGYVMGVAADLVGAGVLGGGVVVTSPGSPVAGLARERGLEVVENDQPAEGLSGSLRLGLDRVRLSGVEAALVVLADQPKLRTEVVEQLVRRWRASGQSVRPCYIDHPDAPGHPVLLDRSLWDLAARIGGDQGLQQIFRTRPEAITLIDVPGRNPDVDTPADLANLEE